MTNRLAATDSTTGQTTTYDNNGNLLSVGPAVPATPTYTFGYDAENRQLRRTDATGTVTNYVYDGEGRRVQTSSSSGGTTTFVYDIFGHMVADYGTPVASPPCQTCYISADHLGTTRMVTDQFGNAVARHDFAPFGDELISGFAGRGPLWGAGLCGARASVGRGRSGTAEVHRGGAG